MKYQTFKSFAEVQKALGFKPKEQKAVEKEEKEIKCRICGAAMKAIPGTNIMACTGQVQDEEGKMVACKNYIIGNV